MKIFDIFLIFAPNIDCGYTLELPHWSMLKSKSKKKSVYPFKPQFYNIKVGCKGVYITRTCLHNAYCKHTAFLSFFFALANFHHVNMSV